MVDRLQFVSSETRASEPNGSGTAEETICWACLWDWLASTLDLIVLQAGSD